MDIAFAALGAIALLCIAVHCLRFIYSYRIGNEFLDVILFRAIPIYRIPITDIQSIKVATWRDIGFGFSTLRLGNRLTVNNMVLIESRGLPRRVVITPSDPHAFVGQVVRLRIAPRPNNSFRPKPLRGST